MIFSKGINAVERTISHNVANSIVEDLKNIFKFKNTVTLVEVDDTTNSSYSIDSDSNTSLDKNIILITYSDKININELKTISSRNPILFKDRDILIRTRYFLSTLNLNFTLKTKSKTEAHALIRMMTLFISEGRLQNKHLVEYLYYLDNDMILLMRIIHSYKEQYINMSFKEYFEEIMQARVTVAFSQDGKPKDFTVSEKQDNVLGMFSGSIDEENISFSDGVYTVSFDYVVRYMQAHIIDFNYNSIVANNKLPASTLVTTEELTPTTKKYLNYIGDTSLINTTSNLFKYMSSVTNNGYIRIPRYDTSSNIEQVNNMLNIFSALVTISDSDKRSLFYLTQLGDISLRNDLVEFIKLEREYIGERGMSLLTVELYEDNVRSSINLHIDENLLVHTMEDLDMLKVYRVILRITPNVSNLTYDARSRLRHYAQYNPSFFKETIFTNETDWFENKENIVKMDSLFNFNLDLRIFENDKYSMFTVLSSYINAMIKG